MKAIKYFLVFLALNKQVCSQGFTFQKIEIDTNYAFRGLSVVDDSVAWVSGRYGTVGHTTNGAREWKFTQVKGHEKTDFRSLYAFNDREAVIANTGSPACILRTNDGGDTWSTVYTNRDSSAFFDGVDFWNDREGIMYGDPVKGHLFIVYTKDGGRSWREVPSARCPALLKGEASFAASGTGIRCYDRDRLMICTGGKASRLFISPDKGKSWRILQPPIVQGKEGTGIFSFAFSDPLAGIVVGGDFDKNAVAKDHVLYTRDGGKSWAAPLRPTGGYRSCVEIVRKDTLMAVGPGGADYSTDAGLNWFTIENQKNFNVIRKARKGTLVIAAGYKKLSVVRVSLIEK